MNRILSWLASLFLESPQEREHRVRQQQAKSARDRLRRNIAWVKAERLQKARAELDAIGKQIEQEFEQEGAFMCDPPEEKSA